MAHPVFDVVRFILRSGDAREDGDSITNMKLQKLLYYFQGFHLAAFDEVLFNDRIEAWEHGPVVPKVWRELNPFGRDPIRMVASDRDLGFQGKRLRLMTNVYEVYGQYSPWRLRRQTHKEPPWKLARRRGEDTGDYEITHDSMRRFFATRLTTNGE